VKRLTLMRHADARWKDPGLADFERPLNRRGTAAAEAMARRLLELELVPDLVLVSPALRTQQTAEIVARELAVPARRVLREDRLYLAAAAELLLVVKCTGPRIGHALVVAHNPGLSELAQLLAPGGGSAALATAAVCSISFDVASWEAIGAGAVSGVLRAAPPRGLFRLLP